MPAAGVFDLVSWAPRVGVVDLVGRGIPERFDNNELDRGMLDMGVVDRELCELG